MGQALARPSGQVGSALLAARELGSGPQTSPATFRPSDHMVRQHPPCRGQPPNGLPLLSFKFLPPPYAWRPVPFPAPGSSCPLPSPLKKLEAQEFPGGLEVSILGQGPRFNQGTGDPARTQHSQK